MDNLIGTKEVMAAFNIGRSTLYRMIDDGKIPAPAQLGTGNRGDKLVWRRSVIDKALEDIMPSVESK